MVPASGSNTEWKKVLDEQLSSTTQRSMGAVEKKRLSATWILAVCFGFVRMISGSLAGSYLP